MDPYPALFRIAKSLLGEDDGRKAPETILRSAIEATGAERGFIVVREGDTFEQRFDVCFDASRAPVAARRFSRSLVREAIETRRAVHSPDPRADPRFARYASVHDVLMGPVVVAPLVHRDVVYGALYLEHSASEPRVPHDDVARFVSEIAEIAAPFLRLALERDALRRRNQALEHDLFAQHDFRGIITRDARMLALLRTVAQVASADVTVLVQGETGVGKDLVARALHLNSPRRDKPFVPLHTAAIPANVLESELFGHERGAFTGADRARAGRIASARGGTLFLDEVAEIPLEVQAKLLRFLQFGEVQRLGSDKTEQVDVRVVAATHQDLAELVASGRFRKDLYFRLRVVQLQIPPLRERPGDIPLLVDHYVRKHWRRRGETPAFSPAAEAALRSHDYPGNVRELEHAVERACILATEAMIEVDLLPPELSARAANAGKEASGSGAAGTPPTRRFARLTSDELEKARAAAVAESERAFVEELLAHHGGNVSQAARESGIHRTYLHRLISRYRVK